MKFQPLAFSIAVTMLGIVANAQGPKELKASSLRDWHDWRSPSTTISLPGFFTAEKPTSNLVAQYQPVDGRYNGILIFVTRVGSDSNVLKNRYKELIHDLKRHEDEKITSKSLSKNSYTVWSDLRDDDKLDAHGEEQELIWYAHSIETPNGLYEIGMRFQPEYRKAITSILPRILSSFHCSPNPSAERY